MGIKLLWTGVTVVAVWEAWATKDPGVVVGAVIMVIGCVLMWLDK